MEAKPRSEPPNEDKLEPIPDLIQAEANYEAACRLQTFDAYRDFLAPLLAKRRDDAAKVVLEGDMLADERERWRRIYLERKELCGLIEYVKQGSLTTIERVKAERAGRAVVG